MKLTDFEALSFDCYGTLIDWEAGLSAVLVPWAAERGLTLTAEQLLTEYAGLEAAVEAEGPARLYPDVLARSMQLLGAKLGAEVTIQDAACLAGSPCTAGSGPRHPGRSRSVAPMALTSHRAGSPSECSRITRGPR